MKKQRNPKQFGKYLGLSALVLVPALVGWFARGVTISAPVAAAPVVHPLRLKGYTYTSPLLAYDLEGTPTTDWTTTLQSKINTFIDQEKANKNVDSISVYLRSYSGPVIDINPSEQFTPASLNKIPLMITLFKMAQDNPAFLDQNVTIPDGTDANGQVEIPPTSVLEPGHTYTVEQAVERMIISSDNNAYQALIKVADIPTYEQTYKDLGIDLQTDGGEPKDFITTKQYSYFLRILYNSTYLDRDYSEKALDLLTQVDYKDGLVAGIGDNSVKVAHKFGIGTKMSGTTLSRELHDCGIVYFSGGNYLLCVMTKSSGTLPQVTHTISGISRLIYNYITTNNP